MQEVTPTNASTQEPVTPPATTPTTPEAPQTPQMEVSDDEKLFSTLCYIPVLSILFAPYAVSKHPQSAFVNQHAAQGLGLFALWFLNLVVISALSFGVSGIIMFVLILVSIYGGINAWGGKALTLPFVKQIGEKFLNWIKGFLLTTGKNVVSGLNQAASKVGDKVSETMHDVVDKVAPTEQPSAESPATAEASKQTQPPSPTPGAPSSDTQNK